MRHLPGLSPSLQQLQQPPLLQRAARQLLLSTFTLDGAFSMLPTILMRPSSKRRAGAAGSHVLC